MEEEAEQQYGLALAIEPLHTRSLVALAGLRVRGGRPEAAIQVCRHRMPVSQKAKDELSSARADH